MNFHRIYSTPPFANTLLSVVAFVGNFSVRWIGSSFAFLVWLSVVVKMQMCYQKLGFAVTIPKYYIYKISNFMIGIIDDFKYLCLK